MKHQNFQPFAKTKLSSSESRQKFSSLSLCPSKSFIFKTDPFSIYNVIIHFQNRSFLYLQCLLLNLEPPLSNISVIHNFFLLLLVCVLQYWPI
ncbi:hypothetical protein ES332_A13G103200v1 [Gossypium tomentosum]|uniref:Uncharacterized protein n=1 Tax=Gossypium tomentosum TaxID=34277 RepID=A0A5D2MIF5_GOSTO|nr:hypothetical protein ES332_A13G103200v1 [Gossypium tomentosum]